jgi:hypothetical protein
MTGVRLLVSSPSDDPLDLCTVVVKGPYEGVRAAWWMVLCELGDESVTGRWV